MKSSDNCKYSTFQCDGGTIDYDNFCSVKYYSDFLQIKKKIYLNIQFVLNVESIAVHVIKVLIQEHIVCFT